MPRCWASPATASRAPPPRHWPPSRSRCARPRCDRRIQLFSASAGSDRQARLEEAGLMALAVDFALVVLGSEVDGDREFRLPLQDLCRVRGSPDRPAHLSEPGFEEGMMGMVRSGD